MDSRFKRCACSVYLLAFMMLSCATLPAWAAQLQTQGPGMKPPGMKPHAQTCGEAIARAEQHYATPPGLLSAIAMVETGRRDPQTGMLAPWPWSVNADNTSYYFATEAEAAAWVREAQAHGTASIDVGCMQVNLFYHPQAFASVDEAFDPVRNADYAARFLMQLCAESGSWVQATGFYHSRTSDLALGYRRQVASVFTRAVVAVRDTLLPKLRLAWGATLPKPSRVPQGSLTERNVPAQNLQARIIGTVGGAKMDHQDASQAVPGDLSLDTGSCWKSRAELTPFQEVARG